MGKWGRIFNRNHQMVEPLTALAGIFSTVISGIAVAVSPEYALLEGAMTAGAVTGVVGGLSMAGSMIGNWFHTDHTYKDDDGTSFVGDASDILLLKKMKKFVMYGVTGHEASPVLPEKEMKKIVAHMTDVKPALQRLRGYKDGNPVGHISFMRNVFNERGQKVTREFFKIEIPVGAPTAETKESVYVMPLGDAPSTDGKDKKLTL